MGWWGTVFPGVGKDGGGYICTCVVFLAMCYPHLLPHSCRGATNLGFPALTGLLGDTPTVTDALTHYKSVNNLILINLNSKHHFGSHNVVPDLAWF